MAGAEVLLARHAEHKAEIDEREKTFQTFNEMGKSLTFKGHFAAREVISGTKAVDTLCKALCVCAYVLVCTSFSAEGCSAI